VFRAAAIDDCLLCGLPKGNDHVSVFFCEHDNASSLVALTIIRSLIRQCLSATTLSTNIEDRIKNLLKNSSLDAEDLDPLLHDVVATPGTTIFVIDGFDECARPDRLIVLKLLHRLMSSSGQIKIFLSSREDVIRDIAREFNNCQQVSMDCEEARTDISTYVKAVVTQKLKDGELAVGNSQLIQKIENALIEGANGM
jgi:hypothetical protein